METNSRTFSIGQIAEKTGLTRRTLRLYEEAGLIVPERAANGYRRYSEKHLKDALVIRELRDAGLSLSVLEQLFAIKTTDLSTRQKLLGCLDILELMEAQLLEKQKAVEATLNQIRIYRDEARSRLDGMGENDNRKYRRK